ncbi:SRPBCC family protein [Streptomyces sp. NPDC093089]|uniref:SRPBCC family protein n=1 Tax=Streptomyces sp. NPDC093089 TaxID=3366024 RepID=UPI0038285BC4
MAAITESIDISRAPADVFGYVTDPTHLPEWQESAVSVRRRRGRPLRRRVEGRRHPAPRPARDHPDHAGRRTRPAEALARARHRRPRTRRRPGRHRTPRRR